jgi:hypothetical protein
MNVSPHEILAARYNLYVAPAGTAIPDLADGAPGGAYTRLGKNGYRNITRDGVLFGDERSYEKFRGLGSAYFTKAFLTDGDIKLEATLADFRLEMLRYAFNDNNVTAVAAGGNFVKKIGLTMGLNPVPFRVIAYSAEGSPYGNFGARIVLRHAVILSSQEFRATRSSPILTKLTFEGMEDPAEGVAEDESVGFIEAISDEGGT